MGAATNLKRLGRSVHELISAEQISSRVAGLGQQITHDYAERGENLVLIGVLKGSVIFLSDLCRHIDLPLSVDFIGIASYGNDTESSGVVQITSDLTRPIEGRDIIIIEDIIDTGLTANYLIDNLRTRRPLSIKLCSLLHKADRTMEQVKIDYLGFEVPNRFLVGYGLDMAQQFRNLDFIGYVEE